jgi:hypothetical protein
MKLFQREAWEMIQILRLGLVGRREFFFQIGILCELLSQRTEYRGRISDLDLEDFFSRILHETGSRSLEKITQVALNSIISGRLLRNDQSFDFYYPIGKAIGFNDGALLGMGRLTPFRGLPKRVQSMITDVRTGGLKHEPASDQGEQEEWFMHITIKGVGPATAALRSEAYFKRSLAAYEALTGNWEFMRGFIRNPFTAEVFVVSPFERDVGYILPDKTPHSVWSLMESQSQLDDVTRLLRKESKSELEQRILSAVDILALIDDSTPLSIRFVLKAFALECLLLSDGDRDYFGSRLAEKVTFVLGEDRTWMAFGFGFLPHSGFQGNVIPRLVPDEFADENRVESRLRLSKEVHRLYGKRSAFAHPHPGGKNAIDENDYDMISLIVRLCISSMLGLGKTGITHVGKKGPYDPKSLDAAIEKMKYQGTSQTKSDRKTSSADERRSQQAE